MMKDIGMGLARMIPGGDVAATAAQTAQQVASGNVAGVVAGATGVSLPQLIKMNGADQIKNIKNPVQQLQVLFKQ